MKLLFSTFGIATILTAVAMADMPPRVNASPDHLLGKFQIVSGERNGQRIAPERIQAVTVRIAKDTITTLDKAEKEVYVATYTLDKTHKPWRIKMVATLTPDKSKGTTSDGLIAVDGNTVKLIYALPGGMAPMPSKDGDSFHTKDKQQMFSMKRAPK